MKNFWGIYRNDSFIVGCNGRTMYVYDSCEQELARFNDIPYGYCGAFVPNSNTFVLKSTGDYIGIYDLNLLKLEKKIRVSKIDGAQDEGFAFSLDGKLFYNIEKPVTSYDTEIGVYYTNDFSKKEQLFN